MSRERLERMREDGWRLVVATSSKPEEMRPMLELVGAVGLLDETASKQDAARSKPDADIVQAALGKVGCRPAEAILLGDTPYDIQAGAGPV